MAVLIGATTCCLFAWCGKPAISSTRSLFSRLSNPQNLWTSRSARRFSAGSLIPEFYVTVSKRRC